MQFHLSQAELQKAIEHYLNDKVLKDPVKVKDVSPINRKELGVNYVLHIDITAEEDMKNA